MSEFFRSRTVWTAVCVWGLFWVLAYFMPPALLADLVNALSISTGLGVLVAYFPGAIRSIRSDKPTGAHYLVLGILCTWFATAARRLWEWVWLYLDQPAEMVNHPAVSFLVYIIFTGGVLHLTAKDAINGHIPPRNWLTVGGVVALAMAAFLLFVIYLEPSPKMAQTPFP